MSPLELAWFAPSCVGDTARLGCDDPTRRATFAYNHQVITGAERAGFDNILIPSSFVPGLDPWTLATAVAPSLTTMSLLPAVRVGEFDPPMFARAAKNLQQLMDGRLTVNIISSELVGETLGSVERYRRTAEAMALLRSFWTGESVTHHGEYWRYDNLSTAPTRTRTPPPMYFGGTSEPAREVAAEHADCYLMWVEGVASIGALVAEMRERAASHGRTLRFGLRTHVIVRDTDDEARAAAADLISELDPEVGRRLKEAAHDHASEGVRRQDALRASSAADGFAEEALWTGIGVARSGVGAAITGSAERVVAKLRAYQALGIDAFILSGYPLDDEADQVGRLVLPALRSATS
ncbi:MAG: LLM class flavin-dependent oxidoreductase [Ilumatobacteraceae bacterium]